MEPYTAQCQYLAMFRNRTSSQRPSDEFIASFRQFFPEVSVVTSTAGLRAGKTTLGEVTADSPQLERHHSLVGEDIKELSPSPREQLKPCRFTPSLLDPNSFAFSNFANQPPEYYTPAPSATNTLYHNQVGDLYTTGMGIGRGLWTALSLPTSVDDMHTTNTTDMPAFSHHILPQFYEYNPLGQTHPEQHQQSSYAPSSFVHQDNDYIEHEGSPLSLDGHVGFLGAPTQNQSPKMPFQSAQFNMGSMHASLPAPTQKFRFHVTLNTPTAMIKRADEIPISYLNKRSVYSISIVDTAPSLGQLLGTRYRTSIRISFENKQQRQSPGTYWQLWREGRGTNEAHQRGGKLQAVEYVEVNQSGEKDDKKTSIDIDLISFDGFSVIWTPGVSSSTSCKIAVRFNFLSTDFSHSKGIKGIPVHLCAKTTTYPKSSPQSVVENSEVVFCKVKLFRDHGAERKLSNDLVFVKKTIDKLKQQISQAMTGVKNFEKRKRAGSNSAQAKPSQRSSKAKNPKRTSLTSPAASAGGRVPVKDDLHNQLQIMQHMLTSARPVSVLYLRGAEKDDPDLHPVTLAEEPSDLINAGPQVSTVWPQRSASSSTGTLSLVSSSPSSTSQAAVVPAPQSPTPWAEFLSMAPIEMQSSNHPRQLAIPPDQPTKVQRRDETNGWINTLGVDYSYNPPIEQPGKPVACFYILHRDPTKAEKSEYYRAVYLMQRTLKGFITSIAAKWYVEPARVWRTLRILDRGLQVEMDDEVICELSEGQDMIMEIALAQSRAKREWEMSVDVTVDSDNTSSAENVAHNEGYELRLMF